MSTDEEQTGDPQIGDPPTDDSQTTEELARVRAERDEAVKQLDRDGRRTRRRAKSRRVVAGVLVVLFAILLPITVTAAWAHRTVLDTGTYVDTVAPIATDPAVTAALSREITDQLYATLDPQTAVAQALPPKAAFLAGPITNGSKGYVRDAVNRVLNSDRFQQLWINANRFAHTQLVAVLRHKNGEVLQNSDGNVTLNLVPLLNAALQNVQGFASSIVGKPITIPSIANNELPAATCAKIGAALNRPVLPTCGQIVIFRAAKLNQARRGVQIFDRAVVALLILTPILFAAALWLSRRRRRTLLQLTIGGALGLVVVRRSLMWLQSDLIATGKPENKSARSVIVHGILDGFFSLTQWFLIGAAVIVVLALVTGPYRWAAGGRSWLHRTGVAMVGAVRTGVSATHDDKAVAYIREHLDAFRVGGVVLAVLILLVANVSFWGFLVLAALLAAYELWLHRLQPPATITLPEDAVLADGIPPQERLAGDDAASTPSGSSSTLR